MHTIIPYHAELMLIYALAQLGMCFPPINRPGPAGERYAISIAAECEVLHTERNFFILSRTLILAIVVKRKLRLKKIEISYPAGGRGARRRWRGRSDWMAIERERGISVSSAVMSFEHDGIAFNLFDTPAHRDVGDRTLTAADSEGRSPIVILESPASCRIRWWMRAGPSGWCEARRILSTSAQEGIWPAVWSGNECNRRVSVAADSLQNAATCSDGCSFRLS